MEKKAAKIVSLFFLMLTAAGIVILAISLLSGQPDTSFMRAECSVLDTGWQYDKGDGSTIFISSPDDMNPYLEETDMGFRIYRKLPEEIPFGYDLGFRLSLQNVRVRIDGKEVYEYGHDLRKPLWNSGGSLYVLIPLSDEYAGALIEIELDSPYKSNRGVVNEFYFGEKTAIMREIYRMFYARNIIAGLFVIGGLLLVVVSVIRGMLNKRNNRKVLYLGLFILLLSSWLLMEGKIIQFIVGNSYFIYAVTFLSLLLFPVPMLKYVNLVQDRRYERWHLIMELCGCVNAAVCILLQVFGVFDLYETLTASNVIMTLSAILMSVTTIRCWFLHKDKKVLPLLYGLIGLVPFGIIEILLPYWDISYKKTGSILCYGLAYFMAVLIYDSIRGIFVLEREKEQAIKESMDKSIFLANMTHEIRTPMNAIVSMSALMTHSNDLSKNNLEYAKMINSSSQNLLSIINDILDYSKFSADKYDILEEPYSLNQMLANIRDIIALRAQESKLIFLLKWDPQLPDRLIGDEGRIRQILLNLLNNAVKYTDAGSICLTVGSTLIADDKIRLICTVTDTGIGIREEDQKCLFEEFTQVDAKKNREREGTGLGLAISKKLAQLMNGTILVNSVYGKGSSFTMSIEQRVADFTSTVYNNEPGRYHAYVFLQDEERNEFIRLLDRLQIVTEEETDLYAVEDAADTVLFFDIKLYSDADVKEWKNAYRQTRLIALVPVNEIIIEDQNLRMLRKPALPLEIMNLLHEKLPYDKLQDKKQKEEEFKAPDVRILAVDDNRVNLTVIREVLKRYEIQVFTAESAKEAIAYLKAGKQYDLILMDYMMPHIDGGEATQMIRKIKGCAERELPIIALTADVVRGTKEQLLAGGMNDYLSKPIDFQELDAALRKFIPESKRKYRMDIGLEESGKPLFKREDGIEEQEVIRQHCMGDRDMYRLIVQTFAEECLEIQENLKTAFDERNEKNYMIYVHGLKTAASSIGAFEVRRFACEMELYGKDGQWDKVTEQHEALLRILEALRRLIQKRLEDK
ncbi:MAG: ATP-binding protein [Lachnospiraceae bacterium]